MAGLLSVGAAVTGTGRFSKVQGTKSGKDMKLERIINKFKGGKKLTSGELTYLAKKNPTIYQKVLRIMQKREQLEERLAAAETKEEAQQIMMQEMQSVENFCANSDDDFEKTALVSQMMDAYGEMTKSDAYQEKPDTNAELAERKRKRTEERSGQAEIEELQRKQKKRKKKPKKLDAPDDGEEDQGESFGVQSPAIDEGCDWYGISGEEMTADPEEISESGEYAAAGEYSETQAQTQTMDVVTYTAQGKKKSTSEFAAKSGGQVDVAI